MNESARRGNRARISIRPKSRVLLEAPGRRPASRLPIRYRAAPSALSPARFCGPVRSGFALHRADKAGAIKTRLMSPLASLPRRASRRVSGKTRPPANERTSRSGPPSDREPDGFRLCLPALVPRPSRSPFPVRDSIRARKTAPPALRPTAGPIKRNQRPLIGAHCSISPASPASLAVRGQPTNRKAPRFFSRSPGPAR